ncbi:MAG TPA: hypothetical protein VLY63_26715 [Anaerolineae bacterium]|nr:hypothetical protein [Anaerolineae bacterium]
MRVAWDMHQEIQKIQAVEEKSRNIQAAHLIQRFTRFIKKG